MQFAQPLWIFAGIVACAILAFALQRMQRRRLETLKRFASAQLLGRLTRHISPGRRTAKNVLLLLAVFLMFVALARPQYGFQWVEVKRKGIDILFALDTSKSMLAEDIRPNRLQRAKLGILDFIEQLEGDRIGLMPFAGSSYLMCPLTLDYDAFAASLSSITTDIIPHGGTNIGEVIRSAGKVLSNDSNHKILILITDGEDLEGEVLETARQAKEAGMTIHTVGVGTASGELIPLPGPQGGFVKDSAGRFVTSRLDEKTLRDIAAATGGIYAPPGRGSEGLETIYQQKLRLIPKEEIAERRHRLPLERFSWPLAAAILLLTIEYLIPERKRNGAPQQPAVETAGRRLKKHRLSAIFLAAAITGLTLNAHRVAASEGEEAYTSQDYLKASEYYSKALKGRPKDPVLHYNYGTAAYKNNLYEQAAASFTEALNSADLELQHKAYFNLGNTLYRAGEEKVQTTPQTAIKEWQEALEAYDAALQLRAGDQQAAENKAFVEKRLEELQKQTQQKHQQGQDEQPQPESDNPQNSQQPDARHQDQEQADQGSPTSPQPEQGEKQGDAGSEQQDSSGEPKQGADEQAGAAAAAPANQQPAEQPAAAGRQAAEQRDAERREQGKMTREEAQNLLNELKGEEGELTFGPASRGVRENDSGRDW